MKVRSRGCPGCPGTSAGAPFTKISTAVGLPSLMLIGKGVRVAARPAMWDGATLFGCW
jgi:hypothetical protein